jgi:hypothetical protein
VGPAVRRGPASQKHRRALPSLAILALVISACAAPNSRDDTEAGTAASTTNPDVTVDANAPTQTTAATLPTAPEAPYQRVAVIGCSQTRDAVHGYNATDRSPVFGSDLDQEYLSGGTIERWAANGAHWRRFASLHRAEAGVDAVWIMLCWHVRSTPPTISVDTVEQIIERAHEVIGHETAVFVSGLNDWDPRSSCPKGDWERSLALADAAVMAGFAERGPALGPITQLQTTDGCHGNSEGNRLMGAQLASFFPDG